MDADRGYHTAGGWACPRRSILAVQELVGQSKCGSMTLVRVQRTRMLSRLSMEVTQSLFACANGRGSWRSLVEQGKVIVVF